MIKKLIGTIALSVLLAANANAASVTLVPLTPTMNLLPGDVVTLEVQIDFSAEGGTLGGGFDVNFDESQLGLVSFTPTVILGDPAFGRPPDYVPGSGLLESWGVADFFGLTTGTVGQISFEVLFGATSSFVSLGPTSGIAGPWISALDFVSIIDPVYGQVEITAVPVPAAVWFMLSGLGALFGLRRSAA